MTDWLTPLAFGVAASVATMLGGVVALRLAERTTAVLAVAAGVVLGVGFLDLLPEALEFGSRRYSYRTVLTCVAAGFCGYLLLTRALASVERRIRWQAHLGPASLTLHSLLDGMLMGFAFQIAPEIGWIVAVAVLTHDVADGMNTVSLALASSRQRTAMLWLLANGAAPLTGVLIGLLVELQDWVLTPLMAVFAGIFVYIGACDLVPRSLGRDGRLRTTFAVLGGVLVILATTTLAE